jgi:hypothetical protein
MKKSKNSEQPISNQIAPTTLIQQEFPEYTELLLFLENELKQPPLGIEGQYELCSTIDSAVKKLTQKPLYTKECYESGISLLQDMQTTVDDLHTMIENALVNAWVKDRPAAIKNLVAYREQSLAFGRWIENSSQLKLPESEVTPAASRFFMFIWHLYQGWKKAYGTEPTISPDQDNIISFKDRKVETGDRGGPFVYFAYAVQLVCGHPLGAGHYGKKVSKVLAEIREYEEGKITKKILEKRKKQPKKPRKPYE